MFKRTKISSAITLAIATTIGSVTLIGLTGCTDGSTSATGGKSTLITSPKGTVVGNVQDTNGNPMAGVTVHLAGNTTTTDAGGNYRFNNVGVVNAPGADGSTAHNPLVITIEAPTGYLGSTVTVEPNALIDGSNPDEVRENDVRLFIDGFIASAGTAVIPELSSTVTGVLRNNATDEPIPNTLVSLDLVTVGSAGGTSQESTHDGINAGYQTFSYTATTGADGSFTIPNVPDDSQLRFEIEGHSFASIDYNASGNNVDTTGEDITTNVGNLLVTFDFQIDDAPPYVISVTGVQDQQAGTGQFNDDIDGTSGIVINFSETMDSGAVDANSVVLYDTTNDNYISVASVAMSADGRSMTITTSTGIPAGANFDINFLRADLMDLSGNIIDTITAAAGPLDDVGFDSIFTSAVNATDVYRLDLRIFQEINTSASSVTLGQLDTDATGLDDDESVQASNAAFADVWDGMASFQQVNAADDDDTNTFADAETRLSAFAFALGATAVETDVARIDFTPVNASYYDITVEDESGTDKLVYDATGASVGTATVTLDTNPDEVDGAGRATQNEFVISALDGSTSTLELVITGVEPGDVVEITPFDDFGYKGATNTLVIADNVPPTAVLQHSYAATPSDTGDVVSVSFGDGGELSNIGSSIVGLPILNVTPQLLDNLEDNNGDGAADSINIDGAADDNLLYELMIHNKVDTVGTGLPYITPVAAGPYDATAFAALAADRTIGFNMSEDVALTATAPTFSGTNATLSGYTASNDVTKNDAGATVNVDLVIADVDDVFLLAADNAAVVDFAGAVEDNAGNAAVDASVVIRDAMPPMVATAVYTGDDMTITFNEPVAINFATDTVTVGGTIIGLTNASLDGTGTVLTILPEDDTWVAPAVAGNATGAWIDETGLNNAALLDGYGSLDASTIFTLPAYSENGVAGISYTVKGTNAESHAALSIADIADTNGNTWTTDAVGLTVPSYAMIETTGDMASSVFSSNFDTANVTTTATIVWSFTHPLDFFDEFNGCATSTTGTLNAVTQTMDNIAVQDCFTLGGGAAFAATGSSASFAANQLTVTFELTAAPASGNTVTWVSSPIASEYDATDIFAVPVITIP